MQIVDGGDLAFKSLIYPEQNRGLTMNYIMNQFNNMPSTITDAGRMFMEESMQVINKLNDDTALQIARNALTQAGEFMYLEFIKPLVSVQDIIGAPPNMQRWIMANPEIRKEYIKGRYDGYSETYADIDPGNVGEDHYDYRRVMDGVLHQDENGNYWINTYYEDLLEGDKELTHDEKFDILQTWHASTILMRLYKEDLTNPYLNS